MMSASVMKELKERLSRKTDKENEKHRCIIMVISERVKSYFDINNG